MTVNTDKVTNPSRHTWGLTPEEWNELADFVHKNQIEKPEIARLEVALKMYQFGKKHNLPAMYRFKKWAEAHELSAREIMVIIHCDLNGASQKYFYPRTSSY